MDDLTAKDEVLLSPSASAQDDLLSQHMVKKTINISSPLPVKRGLAEQSVVRAPSRKLNLGSDDEDGANGISKAAAKGSKGSTTNNNSLVPKSKVKQYQCALCPNDPPYAGASGLWYHMKRHHGAKTRPYNKRKDAEKMKKSAKKKGKKGGKDVKKKGSIGIKRPRGRQTVGWAGLSNGEKSTPPRNPKSHKQRSKRESGTMLGKNGKPLSKYMMKKCKALEQERAKKQISQMVSEWMKKNNQSYDSEYGYSGQDCEAKDATISRNSDLMSLVKRNNEQSSSKYLNSVNDPFLLLAEVAECVSPRKKQKKNYMTSQESKDIGAFPSSPSHR